MNIADLKAKQSSPKYPTMSKIGNGNMGALIALNLNSGSEQDPNSPFYSPEKHISEGLVDK
jgi:hypothetical protein